MLSEAGTFGGNSYINAPSNHPFLLFQLKLFGENPKNSTRQEAFLSRQRPLKRDGGSVFCVVFFNSMRV
jgi:hypothetical protein